MNAKQIVTPLRVGVFVVAAGAAFGAYLQIVSTQGYSARDSYRVQAYFDDVLGLEKKSPVQVAGIDIGAIDAIELEAGKAKLTLRIKKDVELFENARLEKTDRDLNAVKMKKTELEAPYKEGKKRLTSMMEYCTLRLEERGKDRTTETPEL